MGKLSGTSKGGEGLLFKTDWKLNLMTTKSPLKQKKHKYKLYYWMLLLLAGIGLLAYCSDGEQSKDTAEQKAAAIPAHAEGEFLNLHDSVKYVGMQTCRSCHEDIYQSFKKTGMGQSFKKADPKLSAANFDGHEPVYDEYSDFYYYPFWKADSSLWIKEFRLDKQGDTTHLRSEEINYIIGSGHHTNSHLWQVNGYVHQVPLTFYTQEQKWDLPPGYEDGHNTRFERIITLECMSCHNAYPSFDQNSMNKYHQVPEGIDCERCHGPGSLHVKEKQEGKLVDIRTEIDYTIVNPAKLSYELQVDVCQRCHMQANAVLKDGKTFMDFKPGMRLSEVFDVFVPTFEDQEDKVVMAAHPERLSLSECFKQSPKNHQVDDLNCISCHNPHQSVKSTKKAYFNQVCQDCHQPAKSLDSCSLPMKQRMVEDNNCVNCHMPGTGTIDIPHVSITDHFIRIPSSDAAPEEGIAFGDSQMNKFKGLKAMTAEKVDLKTLATAYLYQFEKFNQQPFLLDSAENIMAQLPQQEYPALWVHLHYLRGNWTKIMAMVHEMKDLGEIGTMNHYRVGEAYFNLGMPGKALTFFNKAGADLPLYTPLQQKRAAALVERGDLQAAKKILSHLLEESPKNPQVHNNVAFLLLVEGHTEPAQQHLEKAIALDPDYEPAHVNKAKWLLSQEKIEEAIAYLEKTIAKYQTQEAKELLEYILQQM